METARDPYTLGLNLCGVALLMALAAGAWGYFIGGSTLLFVLVALVGVVGAFGIGLVALGFYRRGER